MRVIFIASDNAGGGRVRSFWPALTLRQDHDVKAWALLAYPKIEPGDVVIIHRPIAPDTLDRVQAAQRAGAIVLVDEDDDLTCLPASNKFRPSLDVLARHDQAIRMADGLIVTTQALSDVYGPFAKRCWTLPNALPEWVSAIKASMRDEHVRVGWAGIIGTHSIDLEWFAPVARQALEGALFTTVGDGVKTAAMLGLRTVDGHDWQIDPLALYKLMARADIGIVPLQPCPFNAAKSGLKALEYQSLGKPVVVVDLPEQRAVVEHGVTGFVAGTPDEFAGYVRMLVRDADLRAQMGTAARAHARTLTLERTAGRWVEVLNQVAGVAA